MSNVPYQMEEEPEPVVEDLPPAAPVVWVAAKNSFYSCTTEDFLKAFRALCEWSNAEPDGPGWVTPVLHGGLWKASARHRITDSPNITVETWSPEAAAVALAVTLDLIP